MLQVKKYYVMIPMLLFVFVLLACSKKDAEVVVNSYVKADSENKKDGLSNNYFDSNLEKLKTVSATNKIKFVDKENKVFWNTIKYNYIDNEYNNTKIQKNNIRIYKKVNIEYADKWVEELDKTYQYIKKDVLKEFDNELEDQYKGFMKYYDACKAMYYGILVPSNNYEGKIDGFDSVRQFYALADDAREYTIMLKEYIFIKTGEVDFYTEQDIKIKSDKHKKEKIKIKPIIINEEQFADILLDNYSDTINCNLKDLTRTKASKKADKYSDYWKEEVDKNYDNIMHVLNKEDCKILKNQKDGYVKYIKSSRKIQKELLKNSSVVDFKYSKNVDIENVIFHGQAYMKYNVLLMEYYYLLTEKIDL